MKAYFWLIALLFVLIAGWYFLSPLFITRTVDDALPEEIAALMPSQTEIDQMSREEQLALEQEVLQEFQTIQPVILEEPMPEYSSTSAEDTGPRMLASGAFRDGDSFHMGSGNATVYSLEDNELLLRFDEFSVTNGPDLRVLLAVHPNPESRADLDQGYIEVNKLKGSEGNQNYTLSPNITLSDYNSVVIYCKPFHVIFSVASLQ